MLPMWIGLGILVGLTFILDKQNTNTNQPFRGKAVKYQVSDWLELVAQMSGTIPAGFTMAWIAAESGGNPCAVGRIGAVDAQGHVLESGIGQLYSPDEIQIATTTNAAMRAGCDGLTQTCTRPLTPDEMKEQVRALIAFEIHCMGVAGTRLALVGLKWTGTDFWKFVKLVHALPGLTKSGLAATVDFYGRAPSTWEEFKNAVLAPGFETILAKRDPKTAGYHPFNSIIAIAERVGNGATQAKA